MWALAISLENGVERGRTELLGGEEPGGRVTGEGGTAELCACTWITAAGCGAQTRCRHVLIHSLKKYLARTCSVPGTEVGAGDTEASRTDEAPFLTNFHATEGWMINQQIN